MALGPSQGFRIFRNDIFLELVFPRGHDYGRSGLLSPVRVSSILGRSFFENYFALAGMTMLAWAFVSAHHYYS